MAKYKIVATPKFPGGGEVELDGYRYKKDASGKWFYSSGAPVTDPLLIQKLTYEAKPVGTPRPTPYAKPDVRTTDMKISAAKQKGMAYQSTLDELQSLEQQKELERLAEQQRLAQDEADRLALENARMNAPFNKSETVQGTVAQLAPVTAEQRANVEASKREYNNKRSFLAERALDENYDAVAYDLAQDIKRDNPGLTFEEALSKAKADYDALKTKALNKYVTQDPDVLARVADERGYNTKSGPGNVTMKQQNLGDPNIVSFDNPNSVEGYYNRGRDILLNPLDAFHYAMSPTESMPYNYKAYEEMKQRTGYQDGADKNLVTGAIDFASWFNPVGLYAQGVKMLPETVESVQRVIDNPTLGNAGTAAFDIGMNALTLAGGKSPLKFIAEETQAVRDAQFASDFMRGRRGPTPTNPGTGYLPIGSPSAEGSPLTSTVRSIDAGVTPYTVESYPTKKPLNIEETLASFSDEEPITRAAIKKKGKGAQKQFLEDLQKDPDYINFRDTATIRNEEGKAVTSYGIPNSVSKDQFRNAGNTYDTVLDVNADPLKKIFHDLSPEYSAEENETIANLIEDIREEKIKLWQSPEGERRLQLLIDNTPELAGHTPKSFVQSVQQLENLNGFYQSEKELNAALNADYDQLEIALNEGRISKRDFQQEADQLDEMLLESEALMSNAENLFEKHAGFYATDANLMGVRPGEFKSKDLPIVLDHEFGHKINSFGKGKTTSPSYLDDELAKLDLVDANAGQLEIPGLVDAAPGMYGMMAPGKNYIDKSINYFLNKSNGTEKVPFLSEIRRDLLQQGIINSAYDKITPKMLKDRYKDYKKTTGEKFPLRLYDIVKDKPQNFNIMSKVINNLPAVLSAAGMADAFLSEDDPNVNQAGLSLLIGAIGKGKLKAKGAKLKSLSKKTTQALAFRDKQLKRITSKLTDDILAHEQAWDSKIQEVNPTLSLFHNEVENIKNKLPNNLESYGIDHDLLMKDYAKQAEITKAEKNIPNIQVTDEGLVAERRSPLANVTSHGESIITSFATGDKVSSTVTMPGYRTSFKIKGKELEIKNNGISNPIISPEYVATLQGNIDHVQNITGAKVYGSAVGVTQGGLPHLTGDIDALILDKDYANNVQNKLEFVTSKGPAQVHDIGIGDVDGHIDFNIIHTNPNGTIKVNWSASPMTGEKRSLELELFRQFFPDEYYAEQKRIIEKFGSKIKHDPINQGINLMKGPRLIDPSNLGFEINIPAKEFMDKIDPAVKTVMDAYESSKDKHINRIDSYINYGDVSVVKKAQETYVKSLVGSKGSLGPQLSKEALSDVNANRQALQEIGFIGDIDVVAENPERMQLALDDYYINNTIHNRQVKSAKSLKNVEDAFKKWSPEFGGGTANGFGLNTVKLGDPNHWQGEILGNIQYKIDVNTSSPVDYVKSVKFATTGSVPFTPEQKEIVKDIIKQYSGIHYDERVGNLIGSPKDVIDIHNPIFRGMAQSGDVNVQRNLQKLYNEITKRLGIRSTGLSEQHTYGNAYYSSILGEFEEAKDLLQYSIITTALKPKSLVQRRTSYKYLSNITPNEIDPDLIKTLGDYQKIENLINGGLEKSKQRSLQIQETIKRLDDLVKEKSERYVAKRNPTLKAEVDKAKKELDDYEKEYKKLRNEIVEYSKQIDEIRKFREIITPVLLSVGVVGAVGFIMHQTITNPSSERHNRPKVIDGIFQTDELSKKEKAYVNKYYKSKGSLKGFTWPDGTGIQSHHTVGEGMLLKNPHLKPPKERFKQGGSIELELTPKQIQEYVAKGYIVEEQ